MTSRFAGVACTRVKNGVSRTMGTGRGPAPASIVNVRAVDMQDSEQQAPLRLNGLILLGVILLMLTTAAIGVGLYLVPPDILELPELQPFVQAGHESDFPVGASRIVDWGEEIILVVRRSETEFAGLQGVSPADGCILEWDDASLRVVSPCTYVVHDLQGNVVEGLTTTPLRKYVVYVRGGIVYVTT